MSEKENQYVATAMFLGMEYKPWLHCYIKINGPGQPETWLDADTMVEYSVSEKIDKLMATINVRPGDDW